MNIIPMEYNVIVEPDVIDDKTKGGVYIPPTSKDREQHAATWGKLVAISPHAFTYEEWFPDMRKPKVGDRVLFARYGGSLIDPDKPEGLRIIKDKDVLAVIEN